MLFRKIDSSSHNVVSSALGFFETPPSNVGISSSIYREILTLNPITDTPYHFKLYPGSNFLDLSHIYLETEMQIQRLVNHVWTPIDTERVSVIQAIGATWIRNLRVTINGRETFNSNSLYSHKAYMDIELSYNRAVKSSYLNAIGYYPSAEGRMDVDTKEDEGYIARRELFSKGQKVQFYTRLNADIFSSDLLMVNNIAIEIEIHPQASEFLLLDYDEPGPTETVGSVTTTKPKPPYRLAITGLKMFCKYVELMEGLSMDIASRLENNPARYGIRRSELKSAVITGGRTEFTTNLFTDQLPRRVIIGLVDQEAYNGRLNKSPFKFNHNNVREISLISGGITWPAVQYNMNWDQNTYMRCYNDMMEGVGLANSIETNGITPQHFKNGWAFFTFTLTSDLENNSAFELIKAGTTSVMIRFHKDLKDDREGVRPQGLIMVAYGEFDTLLMVDKNRSLTSDMSV